MEINFKNRNDLIKQDNFFILKLNQSKVLSKSIEYIDIFVEPINDNWINNAKIFSHSFKDEIFNKRILGANRILLKTISNTMIIRISCDNYINWNETIYIGGDSCTRMSILEE